MALDVKIIHLSDIARCPKGSMLPAHFHADGSCRCAELGEAKAALDRAEFALRAAAVHHVRCSANVKMAKQRVREC